MRFSVPAPKDRSFTVRALAAGVALACTICTGGAHADESHADESHTDESHTDEAHTDLEAHEHGAATLDIALDGTRLYLDLDSPADNVLGFEYAPSTEAERAAVVAADRVLRSAALFVPDAAGGCTLEEVEVAIELPDAEESDDEHGGHADVTTSHVYVCENPEALRSVETTLFEQFDGFVDIDVQLVGPGGQDGAELSADEPVVRLERIL